MRGLSRAGVLLAGLTSVVWAQGPQPGTPHGPGLECEAEYSIFHWRQVFQPEPEALYDTPGVELGRRFRFKVTSASRQSAGDTLHIQVSYWDGRQYSILQHATYGPELIRAALAAGGDLTGEQRLYSPDLGRQLLYRCRLRTERGSP